MIPLRITLEGFLSYRGKQVINFDGSPLWVLWGPNGVGKSAVFDAITFALFNKHRANAGRHGTGPINDIINHASDRLIVVFDFTVDGAAYRIRRVLPRKGRPTREAFIVNSADMRDLDNAPTKRLDDTDSEEGFNRWVDQTIGIDYKAFITSYLLLQGKSEQLLDDDVKRRYELLTQLIDLSPYQKLYNAAEEQRKSYRGRVETLAKQLSSPDNRAVSDEEIDQATQRLSDGNAALNEATTAVERYRDYLELARQWESDSAELLEKKAQIQEAQVLLGREAEITDRYAEWQELENVLPTLKQLVEDRISLLQLQQNLDTTQRECRQIEEEMCNAESNKSVAEQKLADADKDLDALQIFSNVIRLRKDLIDRRTGNNLVMLESAQAGLDAMRIMHSEERDFGKEQQDKQP